ncbi:MAG TPA: carbon storage regulator [Gemmataceae bacterium]|nr:carbon storage regulator [Gemmataceae bacterium]
MLVLSRKPGESIQIGDGITVKVLRVRGERVWVGIEADPDISIQRGELHEVRMMIRDQENDQETKRNLEPEPDIITWQ